MAAVAAALLPTRSQIQNWPTAHLDALAAVLDADVEQSGQVFAAHVESVQSPGGTEWEGRASCAAYDTAREAQDVVRAQGAIEQGCAHVARRGADDIRAMQQMTLDAIADAEGKGYAVAEDLSVTDTKKVRVLSEEFMARKAEALQHSEFIGWHASKLVQTEDSVAADLTTKAAELDGQRINPSDDGTVQMLDDEDRKSPKDQAKDRLEEEKKEHSEPRTPPPDQVPEGTPIEGGTPGGEPYPNGGLGEPVEGTSLPEQPKPPAWEPVDPGAGPFGSVKPNVPEDQYDKWEVEAGAWWKGDEIPHAARNMEHYLDATGTPLTQDVKQMLNDLPDFRTGVDTTAGALGADAISRAQALGATGPLTFPINTNWNGMSADLGVSKDWFYSTGLFDYNLSGQVTVFPPSDGRDWRYEMSTDVNMRDRYNWDLGKSTPLMGTNVTDAQMARFHLIGYAREFTMYGSTGIWRTGG